MADSAATATAPSRPALRTRQGVVTQDAADKTIRVQMNYQTMHPKYGKYLTRRSVVQAHDEANEAKKGDTVLIAECRPLSKTKHHRLLRIVERGPDNR
ncbi:MAG: 30S ribosomal protein S17 [Planctomycetota bacterium]